jgi:predicted AlkP superfamily pyrophosphatase or phosphodiesterase
MKQAFLFFAGILFGLSTLPAQPKKPALIIFISVDQMRADYVTRYEHYFHGGLKRVSEGIVFANGELNYATSETGPGHATLGTGCYPHKSGIIANDWIEEHAMKEVYCVQDSSAQKVDGVGGGSSPRNLKVTAIGDWLKQSSPLSKVITASAKDRAAILMGGQHPDYAFWYNKSVGGFVTSDYYTKSLPQFVKDFNASGWIEKNVPDVWTKSLPEKEYDKIGPDEYAAETKWGESSAFPHAFTKGKKAEQIMGTPYGDNMILNFGADIVKSEKLGQRGVTDILCLSLSNCDYAGHAYGPDSHEIMDLLIKMDENLGKFFDAVDELVGKKNYVVALSADHAVCPLPEFNAQFRHIPAKRYIYATDVKPVVDSLNKALDNELNTSDDVVIKNSYINYSAAAKAGIDSIEIEKRVMNGLLASDAVVDIYFRRELMSSEKSDKKFIEKYRNSYYVPRGEDFQYRVRENCIISYKPYGATHGSPYTYDTHVPVIFWYDGITPATIQREVHSADIAPTLAKLGGFNSPNDIEST